METEPTLPDGAETILFRPSKKRKVYRQRAVEDDDVEKPLEAARTDVPSSVPRTQDRGSSPEEDLEGTRVSVTEILRLRKLRKHRVGGVEFRAVPPASRTEDPDAGALVLHEETQAPEGLSTTSAIKRFAPQTGVTGSVDKHMMAYIDTELKKRLNGMGTTTSNNGATATTTGHAQHTDATADKTIARQPATLGKILEVDLGNEAHDKNVARTEQAARRLAGEDITDDSTTEGKPQKVRLGPDGKPWRSRRKRRTSADIARDQLVEQVLKENTLGIYEQPVAPPPAVPGDGEADDAIAEAFKREFLDAVMERQRKKPPAAGSAAKKALSKEEELLKGPKLGGSRSARAAMREAQLRELAGKKR